MLCACGCGNDAGFYLRTFKGKSVKGEPKRFLHGHGGMLVRMTRAKATCVNGHPKTPENKTKNRSCKICVNERQRLWRENNPEKAKQSRETYRQQNPEKEMDYYRMRRFKIEPSDFRNMLEKQNNKCALCPVVFTFLSRDTTPCVDHDHACCSGKITCGKCVRGLICWQCNAGLGSFKDNVTTLENAIQYLKETQCKTQQSTSLECKAIEPTPSDLVKLSAAA